MIVEEKTWTIIGDITNEEIKWLHNVCIEISVETENSTLTGITGVVNIMPTRCICTCVTDDPRKEMLLHIRLGNRLRLCEINYTEI